MYCRISIMTLIGFWRFTGTPTHKRIVTVGNNETTSLRPDSVLGEFTKASESRTSETTFAANSTSYWSDGCLSRIVHSNSSVMSNILSAYTMHTKLLSTGLIYRQFTHKNKAEFIFYTVRCVKYRHQLSHVGASVEEWKLATALSRINGHASEGIY